MADNNVLDTKEACVKKLVSINGKPGTRDVNLMKVTNNDGCIKPDFYEAFQKLIGFIAQENNINMSDPDANEKFISVINSKKDDYTIRVLQRAQLAISTIENWVD